MYRLTVCIAKEGSQMYSRLETNRILLRKFYKPISSNTANPPRPIFNFIGKRTGV
jgi:hypothetical protein